MYHSACSKPCSVTSFRITQRLSLGRVIGILALCAGLLASFPAWSQGESIVHSYTGTGAGDWSNPSNVVGPADNNCSNMGAVDKANLTYNFDFIIPVGATITGATAFIKAGAANSAQNIGVQLASNASVDPPTTIGNQIVLEVPAAGSGACSVTTVASAGTTLASWGLANLAPATVNTVQFGLVFTKLQTSTLKVDSICLQITYLADGPITQLECFSEPPVESSSITIVKQVVGTPPETPWDFSGDGDIGGAFQLPAGGGFFNAPDLADDTYTITETTKEGYTVTSECFIDDVSVATGDDQISVAVAGTQSANCVFINTLIVPTERATFRVTKDFTDDNPSEVSVSIDCNTGLILDQSKLISEGDDVIFVVTDFGAGDLDCEISEEIPNGYSPTYAASIVDGEAGDVTDDGLGCYYEEVVSGEFACLIVNTPDAVDVVIEKVWVIEGSGGDGVNTGYELTLYCDAEIVGGSTECGYTNGEAEAMIIVETWCETFSGDDSDIFTGQVIPEYPNSECWVDEEVFDDYVEIDNDCDNIVVSAGNGDSCVITNTVFFEGIPTLSQYGKILLVMLMLGVGIVGFRRFS